MTLCIAWKNGNNISFSSDSRLSADDTHHADIGIKVMDVPVRIIGPTSETGEEEVVYDHKLGLCYCGDTIAAMTIKETIAEALLRLQAAPGYTDYSLNGICKTVAKFVENTVDELRNGAGLNDPTADFLLGGFCPENEKVMIYKFEILDRGTHFEAVWHEVLTNENAMEIMGSGRRCAQELIAAREISPGNNLLKVLRDVCKDNNVPSVGGNLQYGHFVNNNFEIKGIEDYAIDGDDNLEYIYAYRGTKLYRDKFEASDIDFLIAYTFITPFKDEIDAYWIRKGIN